MPLEIRELHIKAVVGADAETSQEEATSGQRPEMDMEEVVRACVDQVLQILKEKAER